MGHDFILTTRTSSTCVKGEESKGLREQSDTPKATQLVSGEWWLYPDAKHTMLLPAQPGAVAGRHITSPKGSSDTPGSRAGET